LALPKRKEILHCNPATIRRITTREGRMKEGRGKNHLGMFLLSPRVIVIQRAIYYGAAAPHTYRRGTNFRTLHWARNREENKNCVILFGAHIVLIVVLAKQSKSSLSSLSRSLPKIKGVNKP
jgi:hypothetical protein